MHRQTELEKFNKAILALTKEKLHGVSKDLRCRLELASPNKVIFYTKKESTPYPIGLRLDVLWQIYNQEGMDEVCSYLDKTTAQLSYLDGVRKGELGATFISCLIEEQRAEERGIVSWEFLPGICETFFLDLNGELIFPTHKFLTWLGLGIADELRDRARLGLAGMLPYLELLGDDQERVLFLELGLAEGSKNFSKIIPITGPPCLVSSFFLLPQFRQVLLRHLCCPAGKVCVGMPLSNTFVVFSSQDAFASAEILLDTQRTHYQRKTGRGVWGVSPHLYELVDCWGDVKLKVLADA